MGLLVFKFVEVPENNEKPVDQKNNRVKFKIMSLKVKGPMDYVPELVRLTLPFAFYFQFCTFDGCLVQYESS